LNLLLSRIALAPEPSPSASDKYYIVISIT
jgi:hypothetical protein